MKGDKKSNFTVNPGSMFQIFLNSDILDQIKAIQNNENLKDEREVIIRAIQNYSKKNTFDSTQQQNSFEDEMYHTTFDGHIEMEKIKKILEQVTSENLIKKLPQHEIYKMPDAGMIHRFHTKILPVKFSLMCLSKMIIEQERPWIDLNKFKWTINGAINMRFSCEIDNDIGLELGQCIFHCASLTNITLYKLIFIMTNYTFQRI